MADKVPSSIALWKPFSGKGTLPLTHDIICVHTMVGSLLGSWNYANGAGNAYWHFGTSGLGECWQCQGLEFRSAANLNGNHRVIPIENADMGPGFGAWNGQCGSVPPFTQPQVAKLIDLIEWLCRRYNIPPVLIPDTLPGRRGIAYHRQGINPWRCANCELWSSAPGKCCPDNLRIGQLVNIIIPEVARRIAGQSPTQDLKENKMYAFVRASDWVAVYMTDGFTKRLMRDEAELNGFRNWVMEGQRLGKCSVWKNGEVDVWTPAHINGIPSVDPADTQLIDFVDNPHGDGAYLVMMSSTKLLLTGQALSDHQAHWAYRGYNTEIQTWTDDDIDAIPEVHTTPPPS